MKLFFISCCIYLTCFLQSCSGSKENDPKFIKSQYESRHDASFSDATAYKDLLFLTGQIGKNHNTGQLVEGSIESETHQVLTNIKDVLEANGSDMNHVMKCTVILSDIADFAAMNNVYKTYFPDNKPARTSFGAKLVGKAKIEIEVIAVKN